MFSTGTSKMSCCLIVFFLSLYVLFYDSEATYKISSRTKILFQATFAFDQIDCIHTVAK